MPYDTHVAQFGVWKYSFRTYHERCQVYAKLVAGRMCVLVTTSLFIMNNIKSGLIEAMA